MARKPRRSIGRTVYHVLNRANSRRRMFTARKIISRSSRCSARCVTPRCGAAPCTPLADVRGSEIRVWAKQCLCQSATIRRYSGRISWLAMQRGKRHTPLYYSVKFTFALESTAVASTLSFVGAFGIAPGWRCFALWAGRATPKLLFRSCDPPDVFAFLWVKRSSICAKDIVKPHLWLRFIAMLP